MFIDKNGKLFGKISFIDILIVLAVIVCVAGVYVRFVAQPDKVQVQTQSFTYKVLVRDVRDVTVKGLEQSIGTTFILNEKGRDDVIGKLVDIETKQYAEPLIKNDSTVVMAEKPLKYEALITLELDGIVNDMGYYTTDLKSISVGANLSLMNKYISTSGRITEISEK